MGNYSFLNGLVYDNGALTKENLHIPNKDVSSNSDEIITLDCLDCYVLPGMIDIHTHGAMNIDFNHVTEEGLQAVNKFFLNQGVTGWLASIVTDDEQKMFENAKIISEYSKLSSNGCIGVHLEGPFLSIEYKGSMPEKYLKYFDYRLIQNIQDECHGQIKYITVAPEVEGVIEGIEKLQALNIVVSIGHSAATYDQAIKAIHKGAKVSTHTLNAMRLVHQHEPAISGAALASNIYCEVICDGLHLHPNTVDMMMKIKGAKKLIAITDSIMATGLSDGNYLLGAHEITVMNGDAKLKGLDIRAGSTLTMIKALKNTMQFTSKKIENVLPLFIDNPADLFEPSLKSFKTQTTLNAVVLDKEYEVKHVIQNGKLIF